MLKDITLGQYFPADTFVHRLDPRTKLLALVFLIVCIFSAKGPLAMGLVVVTLCLCVAISRIRPSALFKGLKPLIFVICFPIMTFLREMQS